MAVYVVAAVTLSLHTAFTQYYCDVAAAAAAAANDVDAANQIYFQDPLHFVKPSIGLPKWNARMHGLSTRRKYTEKGIKSSSVQLLSSGLSTP